MNCSNQESLCFNSICEDSLTGSLQALSALIGVEDTYRLSALFGGQDIYIPKNPEKSRLSDPVNQLDLNSLQTLSKCYGGTYLNIPTTRQFDIRKRNKMIIDDLMSGHSRAEVAKRYQLGVRQIANIKKEMKISQGS